MGSDPDFSSVSYVCNSLNLNLGHNILNFGENFSWVFVVVFRKLLWTRARFLQ